jgi:mannosyltransferase
VSSTPRTTHHAPRTTLQAVLLAIILLLALGLRLYRLSAQSLWNDEGTSVAVAQRDLPTIARDAAADIHPPLYYWLLHGWIKLAGTSEAGVRSLSALLGVGLVALVYALGRLLAGRWAGLAAAFLAAINPFQVYYSQEARMYMLLAVWTALLFYAALRWLNSPPFGEGPGEGEGVAQRPIPPSPQPSPPRGRGSNACLGWSLVYLLAGVAGLYTHYAFPLVLVAVNLVVLLDLGLRRGQGTTINRRPERAKPAEAGSGQDDSSPFALSARRFIAGPLAHWLALQAAVALLFLPWLPTAIQQLTTWPHVEQATDLVAAVTSVAQLLLAGPAAPPLAENLALVLLLVLLFLPSRGSERLPPLVAGLAPVVWLVVPVVLILGLGLFKEAYLKFLLVVSPAFCLLAGRFLVAPLHRERILRTGTAAVCALLALYFVYASAFGLHSYYHDPTYARDDYRSIAAYVEAVGRPGDAVLLNAPGQQEVFGYYYHGALPVYPLPASRPLDPAATEAALEVLAQPGGRVFAVLWATDESDPGRFIEGWLDAHAYKALDSWYGNVRLAVYAVPARTPDAPDHRLDVRLHSQENGDAVTLLGYSLLTDRLAAGDIAPITLFWQVEQTPAARYKVFLHVLDGGDHIVGQRDAEPGGGARLTTLWQPGEGIADNYGVPIHPATPPGAYRVEVGMYNLETGQRLLTPEGEGQVWLEPLAVERPSAPAPVAALGMQHPANADLGELALLGYDASRLGYDESEPLRPGDLLHVALYWRAEMQPSGDWRVALALVNANGEALTQLEGEPVGGYPTSRWLAGDVWRGQFTLAIPGDAISGRYRLRVQPIAPDGSKPEPFLSGPLTVHP